MNKLWLIIQREYLTRVRRRSFILATLLTPLAFGLFFVVVYFIFSYEGNDARQIVIVDEGNILNRSISDDKNLYFKFVDTDLQVLLDNFEEMHYEGVVYLPKVHDVMDPNFTIHYYSNNKLTLDLEPRIRERVRKSLYQYKVDQLQLDPKALKALDIKVDIDPHSIKETENETGKLAGQIATIFGFMMGIVMYFTVFIYGMMVMRSVMEEKTSRIVEVMISSVRPFQLMMGKIIGVGAVGLTQVAIWAILIPLILIIVNLAFGIDPQQLEAANPTATQMDPAEAEAMFVQVMAEINRLNWWAMLPLFLLYFLGGYFMYASMFAAVGSAMGDDLGEGQALTLPITIPVLLAFYIMIAVVESPNSSLGVWSSLFPLFSPIVMPARLAFDPPVWQVVLSITFLLATSIFFVWLSGRIYRVGILMYGKKVSMRELGKWLFYRG
ncbi:MAG: ABC transporter permease [Saprospiraceae bacterium]|nr:MAG: ABC transporter permease [Saprospiraceae bacterium]